MTPSWTFWAFDPTRIGRIDVDRDGKYIVTVKWEDGSYYVRSTRSLKRASKWADKATARLKDNETREREAEQALNAVRSGVYQPLPPEMDPVPSRGAHHLPAEKGASATAPNSSPPPVVKWPAPPPSVL